MSPLGYRSYFVSASVEVCLCSSWGRDWSIGVSLGGRRSVIFLRLFLQPRRKALSLTPARCWSFSSGDVEVKLYGRVLVEEFADCRG